MIEVRNLKHDYAGKGNYAVKDITFSVDKGRIFGFLGPSGAGKSTVQNIMTGLLPLQEGKVLYEGQSLAKLGARFYNKIGYSFELPNVYLKLTALENLKYYAGLFTVPTEDPMYLLDRVGLKNDAHKRASQFSKGMKQRLVFARALVNKPEILFLDEPLSGLDPSTGAAIKDLIAEQKDRGVTIFMTTHNMFLAEELCDTVAFINEGRIVAQDTPWNLKQQYGERSVRVEYAEKDKVASEVLFPGKPEDSARLKKLIGGNNLRTIHSQEATLEQIFIRLTGRGLA